MKITGEFIVGSVAVAGKQTFRAIDPSTGSSLEPVFHVSDNSDVERACALANEAFETYRHTGLEERAKFLEAVADNIGALGDDLITRAMSETGLPRPRLEGERQRTINQLRLFAAVVRHGDWCGFRIDPALDERTPRRPDLRMRRIPLGPVAVFGASNFPLAFSVAGGDTASALAAGCPVIVKGHPAHPGVSELVGRAIAAAVIDRGLPPGVFSLLAGPAHELGTALVTNPHVSAVGFTGSRTAGLALCAAAAARPVPVPVFAEMSSVNPVFLLPGSLQNADNVAQGCAASMTLGAGQFCTNPGLIFAIAGSDLDRFISSASATLANAEPQTMLTPAIHAAYERAVRRLAATDGVTLRTQGPAADRANEARPALFVTDGGTFEKTPLLAEEAFGPASIIVSVADADALVAIAGRLEGQLTASVHMEESDWPLATRLVPTLERKAGRIIANGWPTGVEVAHAMVHGGPFPATSDSRTTSVGALAIDRFLRPVCYQDFPAALLPSGLRDSATGIDRLIDGVRVAAANSS